MIFYWEDHECTAFVINCFLLSGSDGGTLACEHASSPEHSGGRVGKGRGARNDISGI